MKSTIWQDLVYEGRGHHRAEPLVVNPQRPDYGLLRSRRPCSRGRTVPTPGVDVRLVSRDRAVAHHPRLRITATLPVHPTTESALSATYGGLPQMQLLPKCW